MDLRLPSLVALNGRITPSLSSFILSGTLREVMLRRMDRPRPRACEFVNPTVLFGDTSAASTPTPHRLRSRVGLSVPLLSEDSVSNQCRVEVRATLVSRRSREASIRNVGSSAAVSLLPDADGWCQMIPVLGEAA